MSSNYENFKLKIDLKPSVYHGNTVRKNIPASLWKKIRLEVLDHCNNTCQICGYSVNEKEELRKLHVHEIEEYNNGDFTVILKELSLICIDCHSLQHIGRSLAVFNKMQQERMKQHFINVNNCDEEDFKDYYRYVMERKMIENLNVVNLNDAKMIKFTVDGEIPYKADVISHLDKKGLYVY